MRSHDIILRPIVSEKSYGLADVGKYSFEVHPSATKTQIKIAVQEIFNVKVVKVNTMNYAGKKVRTRFGYGTRKAEKHAIVSLPVGETINVFGTQG